MTRVLVTGGAGFIGSALIRFVLAETDAEIVNVDKLTYAASPEALGSVERNPRYRFEKIDICDGPALRRVFDQHQPDGVIHLAAESHVDRSIDAPAEFIQTNVIGSYVLLQESLRYFENLPEARRKSFRHHHVSTDEVFGSLGPDDPAFSELSRFCPNSPYAASKASSDHLTRAWQHTFGLPTVSSNSSNNYGPFQFPEKLIPLMIIKGLAGEELPIYGDGKNVRDWLYVEDHARGLWTIFERGKIGETYNVGGRCERANTDVVETLCSLLDRLTSQAESCRRLIRFVADRPGHDRRYAVDCSKLERELGFVPRESFESGLEKTVRWYLANRAWWEPILMRRYRGERLGLGSAETGRS